jgi:cytochrome b561
MQKGVVVLMHEVFYMIIFVVLITGFLMLEHSFSMFGIWHIPQPIESLTINRFFFTIHRYACILLVVMLVLHVLAVVKHSLMGNKGILKRMA